MKPFGLSSMRVAIATSDVWYWLAMRALRWQRLRNTLPFMNLPE